jgi:hypothetical protein
MNKHVYMPDSEILAQREEADETYIGHRYSDAAMLAVGLALVLCAVLIGYFAPLLPAWLP